MNVKAFRVFIRQTYIASADSMLPDPVMKLKKRILYKSNGSSAGKAESSPHNAAPQISHRRTTLVLNGGVFEGKAHGFRPLRKRTLFFSSGTRDSIARRWPTASMAPCAR